MDISKTEEYGVIRVYANSGSRKFLFGLDGLDTHVDHAEIRRNRLGLLTAFPGKQA